MGGPAAHSITLYFPRVTAYRRKGSSWGNAKSDFRIEFSAAKLLFQNNVDEPSDDQFDELISVLIERTLPRARIDININYGI